MCSGAFVQDFLQRADLEKDLSAFSVEHGYNMLLAMTISFKDNKEPFRQLAIFSHSTLCREEVGTAAKYVYLFICIFYFFQTDYIENIHRDNRTSPRLMQYHSSWFL